MIFIERTVGLKGNCRWEARRVSGLYIDPEKDNGYYKETSYAVVRQRSTFGVWIYLGREVFLEKVATVKIEEQINQFERCVEAFADSVSALDKRLILRKVTSWTVRDIVAHLIGWNRYIVQGSKQILRGELPFYDVDPGPNYSNVNVVLVSECSEKDRSALLNSFATSTSELVSFLRTIDPDEWDHDFGVRHNDETITVKSTIDDLIADYHHHRVQLEEFGASAV